MDNEVQKTFEGLLTGARLPKLTRDTAVALLRRYPKKLLPLALRHAGGLRHGPREGARAVVIEWIRSGSSSEDLELLILAISQEKSHFAQFAHELTERLEHERPLDRKGRLCKARLSYTLADWFRSVGDISRALRLGMESLSSFGNLGKTSRRERLLQAKALRTLSAINLSAGKPMEAWVFAVAAEEHLPSGLADEESLWAAHSILFHSIEIAHAMGNINEVRSRLMRVKSLLVEIELKGANSTSRVLPAIVDFMRMLFLIGDHEEAHQMAALAWKPCREFTVEDPVLYLECTLNCASVYGLLLREKGMIEEGYDVDLHALGLLGQLSDLQPEVYLRRYIHHLCGHASVCSLFGDTARALESARSAVMLLPNLRKVLSRIDLEVEGMAHLIFGQALVDEKRLKEAVEAYQTGLRLLKRTSDSGGCPEIVLMTQRKLESVRELIKRPPQKKASRS